MDESSLFTSSLCRWLFRPGPTIFEECLHASHEIEIVVDKLNRVFGWTAVKEFQLANSGVNRIRRQNGVRYCVVVAGCVLRENCHANTQQQDTLQNQRTSF